MQKFIGIASSPLLIKDIKCFYTIINKVRDIFLLQSVKQITYHMLPKDVIKIGNHFIDTCNGRFVNKAEWKKCLFAVN